jgi:alpha-1,2-mannosyltransferase
VATSSALSGRARRRGLAPNLTAGQARLLLRLAAIGAAAVAVKSFVVDPLTGHFGGTFEDFGAYMGAARSMAAGGSPYAQFSDATPVMSGFTYPPFAAILVRPLAHLSDSQALSVWLLLSLATTVTAAIIVARVALPASWPRFELAILAAVAFGPAAYNYWHGQINGVIFLLLAVAYWAYVDGRQSTTGVVLVLAAGIKVAPVVLLVLLVRRRWWRGSAALLATVAATIAAGVLVIDSGPAHTFLSWVLPTLSRPAGWLYNQSITGVIARLAEHSVLVVQATPLWLTASCWLAGVLILGMAGWVVRPGDRPAVERGGEFGLGVAAMLLAGSLAWYAHFTALLIPLAAAAALAAERSRRTERRLVAVTAVAVVVFAVVAPFGIAQLAMPSLISLSRTPLWWPLLQLSSLPALAALWLAVRLRASLAETGLRSSA